MERCFPVERGWAHPPLATEGIRDNHPDKGCLVRGSALGQIEQPVMSLVSLVENDRTLALGFRDVVAIHVLLFGCRELLAVRLQFREVGLCSGSRRDLRLHLCGQAVGGFHVSGDSLFGDHGVLSLGIPFDDVRTIVGDLLVLIEYPNLDTARCGYTLEFRVALSSLCVSQVGP